MTEPRMVHEYSSETGLVVREETEADRAFAAALKDAFERHAAEPMPPLAIPVNRHVYAALKRVLPRNDAPAWRPRFGEGVVVDEAWGPYRRGRRAR